MRVINTEDVGLCVHAAWLVCLCVRVEKYVGRAVGLDYEETRTIHTSTSWY